MPRISTQDTRTLILDQAEQLFLTRGYMETVMAHIAQACDITKPALYHHFRDKSEIYLGVIERGIDTLHQQVTEMVEAPGDLHQRLVAFGDRLAANPHADYQISQQVMRQHFTPEQHGRISALFFQRFILPLIQFFGSEMAAGRIRRGTPELMVFAFLSLVTMVREMRRSPVMTQNSSAMDEAVRLLLPD